MWLDRANLNLTDPTPSSDFPRKVHRFNDLHGQTILTLGDVCTSQRFSTRQVHKWRTQAKLAVALPEGKAVTGIDIGLYKSNSHDVR